MKACYIHVPFCRDICSYCDFTRCRYHAGLCDKWLLTVQKEINDKLKNTNLETIYVGGGTPSALNDIQLKKLLSYIQPHTEKVKEYTIEVNVDSLTDEKLEIMSVYGIQRISLGVQTLQEKLLKEINRFHTREDVLVAIDKIHAHGIHNISIDLIYGLPHQCLEDWKNDLQDVLTNFDIQHISLYSLTIEKHSTFARMGIQQIDETLEADMFEYAMKTLEMHGFEHYEISNFAKAGMRSKHNQIYWKYEDFIGIGCGASGKEQHRRYDNTKNLQTYFEEGASPTYIAFDKESEMFETIMMGLRMKEGVCLSEFQNRFNIDLCNYYKQTIQKQIEAGMLKIDDDYVHTTYKGMLLLNDVLVDFLD